MENVNEEINPMQDALFIVLLFKNDSFTRAAYDIEIAGKKMWEWVSICGSGAKIKTIPCTEETDIISLIKPFVENEKYTFVFYSDTPLITRANVLEIFEYFKQNNLSVLKLKRGYVFENAYLLNCESVLCDYNKMFDGNEFFAVDSFIKLAEVREIIKRRINRYHMKNAVNIIDFNSTNIDADVIIEKGATIYPNNCIYGQSYIGENAVLEPSNVVKDSIISSGAVLKGAYVQNSRVSENTIISPFEKIIDKNI